MGDNLQANQRYIKLQPNITLRRKLEQKLVEYNKRLIADIDRHPFYAPEEFASWYAARILSELLESPNGVLDTWNLSRKIAEEHGGAMSNLGFFENYCSVIDFYATGNGNNPRGGTGLPDVD